MAPGPSKRGEGPPATAGATGDGDTLLGRLDTPHLRNEIQRRLFGPTIDPLRIGRFPVLRRLGQGGMGVVYAAYDNELDRKIAIKLLRTGTADDDARLRERLLREAKALARLQHPNIVTIYEVGEHEGQVFLAMQFVEGPTLRRWCEAEPRTAREILDRYLEVAAGLAAAHAAGLVHRDVKPDNAIVGADGHVRVLDFGLATTIGEVLEPVGEDVASAPLERLTRTGAVLGTPAYMAPEQFLGRPADARSDQFGFAVALWEALLGTRPYGGDDLAALARALAHDEPAIVRARGDVAKLTRVLRRALARDPAARYVDMAELGAALRGAVGQRWRALPIAMSFSVALAGSWWVLRSPSDQSAQAIDELSATVSALGGEVESQRSRADDAEAALRRRADVLTLAEARFVAARDPSVAMALLARLSDDPEMWGADTWAVAQRASATAIATRIDPVPAGLDPIDLLAEGRVALVAEGGEQHRALWWPGTSRVVRITEGRGELEEIGNRWLAAQPQGSSDVMLWDLLAGAPVGTAAGLDLSWATSAGDGTLVARSGNDWFHVAIPSLVRTAYASEVLPIVLAGPQASWAWTVDRQFLGPDGKPRAQLPEAATGNSFFDHTGDGWIVRLSGNVLTAWDPVRLRERRLERSAPSASATSIAVHDGAARLAVGDREGHIDVIALADGTRRTLRPFEGTVEPRPWLDADHLVASTERGGVVVDVTSGRAVELVDPGGIGSATRTPAGELATISERTVRSWVPRGDDVDAPRELDAIAIAGPDASGAYVGLRSGGEVVRWVDGVAAHVGTHAGATSIALADRGGAAVSSGRGGVWWWSLAGGSSRNIGSRGGRFDGEQRAAIDPSGRFVAAPIVGGVGVVDMDDGSARDLADEASLHHVEFSRDAPRLYAYSVRGSVESVRWYDTSTWELGGEIAVPGTLRAVGPRGMLLVRNGEQLVVLQPEGGQMRERALDTGFVADAALSRDGHSLLAVDPAGEVLQVDVASGRVAHLGPRLRAHARTLGEATLQMLDVADGDRVAFDPSGTRVLILDPGGAIQVSEPLPPVAPAELAAWTRAHAPVVPRDAALEQLSPAMVR